jgi:hypothetical protein
MPFRTCRLIAVALLTLVLFLMPGMLFCRWMLPAKTPDISVPNDYWTAVFMFVFAIALPAVAFILANTKISSFGAAKKESVRPELAWLALAVLFGACVYIVLAAAILFFVKTKEHTDYIAGLGVVAKTVRYPIDEAMNIICSFFGPLITLALSMDVLSLPLRDRPKQ